jgi:hypothetical protein
MNITEVSTPSRVYSAARKMFGNNVMIELSERKNKKYKLWNPNKKTWVHFGDSRYEDFTKHGDAERRRDFRSRNAKWADAPMYSPAHLAYWILW